jgi:energy-converting hydrogenase Eha subunit A
MIYLYSRRTFMNKLMVFAVVVISSMIASVSSAATFDLVSDLPRPNMDLHRPSYQVGQCTVTDYIAFGHRYIFIRMTQSDGVVDMYSFTAWFSPKGELREMSYRSWKGTPNPNEGPRLLETCPLSTASKLPKEVRELKRIEEPR